MNTTTLILIAGAVYLVLGPPKLLSSLGLGGSGGSGGSAPAPAPASAPDLGTQIVGGAVAIGTELIHGIFGTSS